MIELLEGHCRYSAKSEITSPKHHDPFLIGLLLGEGLLFGSGVSSQIFNRSKALCGLTQFSRIPTDRPD